MASEKPARPLPRHPSVLWSRLRWKWPILVWLFLAVFALWLYENGGEYIRINGMVEVVQESVAPLETGRLKTILVREGQVIEAGDIVAEMDTTLIDEEIALRESAYKANRAEDLRQFLSASQRVREELRAVRLAQAETQAELDLLLTEQERIEGLIADRFATAEDIVEIDLDVASRNQRLIHYAEAIEELEAELVNLNDLRSAVLAQYEPVNGDDAIPSRLQLLEQRRQDHILRASESGTVSRIRRQPGEVIDAGQRILDIITRQPPRILAFMDETDTRPISIGEVIDVEPAVGGNRFRAEITGISPQIIAVPDRASPIPNQVVRGRRLELIPVEPMDLPPGTSLVILLPRGEMFWTSIFGGWKPGE
ncbi:MAG: HlyD family secretion protein [Puniceicoccaceae bacterium]